MKYIKLSKQPIALYRAILKEAFNRPVVFTTKANHEAEMRITNVSENIDRRRWLGSQYPIDVVPAIGLTSRSKGVQSSPPLMGNMIRPYMLQGYADEYLLDDMNVALALLKKKRIDGIVDYAEQGSYYVFDTPELSQNLIQESQNMTIFFSEKEMLNRFEKVMRENRKAMEWGDSALSSPYSLDGVDESDKTAIQFYMIPKRFDFKVNKLSVTDDDMSASKWFEEHMNLFSLQFVQGNSSRAYKELEASENVCILNTFKTEDRGAYSLYSSPTHIYLDFHLYVRKGGAEESSIQRWKSSFDNEKTLNLKDYFDVTEEGLVGYYEYIDRTSRFESEINSIIQKRPARFFKLKADENTRSVELLLKKRIDYLITYPFVLQEQLGGTPIINDITGFSFDYYDKPRPVYVACSKSAIGEHFILKLNEMLKNRKLRGELLNALTKKMVKSDKQILVEEFEGFYLN